MPEREIKRRVTDAASILGIEELLDRKPKSLSGAQRQRVAVARAVVRQAKVFLVDAPLSNFEARMRSEIVKLHQRLHATMIYATHDPLEAMTIADRIIIMNQGLVQQNDAPLRLYNEPANLFVAGFLGSPPMNFISGTLRDEGEKIRFRELDGGTIDIAFFASERPAARAFVGKNVILGIRPEDLTIDRLLSRVAEGKTDEIIMALSATVDGQATAHYIGDRLQGAGVKISRLAHGIPVGGDLDYLDDGTIATAMKSRASV